MVRGLHAAHLCGAAPVPPRGNAIDVNTGYRCCRMTSLRNLCIVDDAEYKLGYLV
jgi:hypothetical protein